MRFAKILNSSVMTNKEIKIAYQEYSSLDELSSKDRELAQAAIDATSQAYAPYSNFNVGASVMYEDGEIIKGSNQENAAFPSSLCAERTALFYASSHRPDKAIVALAIAASQNGILCNNPVTPCGACRQVMAQYQSKGGIPMNILLIGASKIWKFSKVEDLLPFTFDSI